MSLYILYIYIVYPGRQCLPDADCKTTILRYPDEILVGYYGHIHEGFCVLEQECKAQHGSYFVASSNKFPWEREREYTRYGKKSN